MVIIIVVCPDFSDGCSNPGTTKENLALKSGYWRVSSTSLNIFECPIKEYCLGGLIYEQCPEYHYGVFCLKCNNNTAKRKDGNSFCEICDDKSIEQDKSRINLAIGLSILCFILLNIGYLTYRLYPLFSI